MDNIDAYSQADDNVTDHDIVVLHAALNSSERSRLRKLNANPDNMAIALALSADTEATSRKLCAICTQRELDNGVAQVVMDSYTA